MVKSGDYSGPRSTTSFGTLFAYGKY